MQPWTNCWYKKHIISDQLYNQSIYILFLFPTNSTNVLESMIQFYYLHSDRLHTEELGGYAELMDM